MYLSAVQSPVQSPVHGPVQSPRSKLYTSPSASDSSMAENPIKAWAISHSYSKNARVDYGLLILPV